MTPEEMAAFLNRPLVVSFTTLRPDGSPHMTPIWYEYDRGKFYCWVGANSVKVRNLGRNPQVALCIATHDEPYDYVVVEGSCEITSEGVIDRATSIAKRYYGDERGAEFVRETMADGEHVLLVVTPTRFLTQRAS